MCYHHILLSLEKSQKTCARSLNQATIKLITFHMPFLALPFFFGSVFSFFFLFHQKWTPFSAMRAARMAHCIALHYKVLKPNSCCVYKRRRNPPSPQLTTGLKFKLKVNFTIWLGLTAACWSLRSVRLQIAMISMYRRSSRSLPKPKSKPNDILQEKEKEGGEGGGGGARAREIRHNLEPTYFI